MQELDEYINRVKHLPPAPLVLPKLLPLLGKLDTDSSQIVEVIMYDPSLTASVLQLCNSAFFASATPATDIKEAVNRLGYNQVYKVVAAVSGSRALSSAQKGYGFGAGELWKHSVAAAVAAQIIAEDLNDDANTAFTAALLHDIGKVILAEALEHVYIKLVQETETNQQSLLETEKKLLGVQHAEIGGRLLFNWKFPESLVAAVWHHHQPDAAVEHQRLASFVYLGNMVAHFMGFSFGHQAFAFRGRSEALSILKLTPENLPQYMLKTFERLEVVHALFGKSK
jgi:putative nucleotidyltransferase with HDIG domain